MYLRKTNQNKISPKYEPNQYSRWRHLSSWSWCSRLTPVVSMWSWSGGDRSQLKTVERIAHVSLSTFFGQQRVDGSFLVPSFRVGLVLDIVCLCGWACKLRFFGLCCVSLNINLYFKMEKNKKKPNQY